MYKHNLDVLMKSQPYNVDTAILKTWKTLKPFTAYNITSELPKLVNKKTYQGQSLSTASVSVIGRKVSKSQLIEGQFVNN
tara:strand:+ start:4045 stop:4284 length:240 start_codon:yes stop_codon:yes gene_type:complete